MIQQVQYIEPRSQDEPMHTIEVHLSDQEYHRVKLICLGWNETPSEVFRNSVNRDIEAGLYPVWT